jgi:hypothetical protein
VARSPSPHGRHSLRRLRTEAMVIGVPSSRCPPATCVQCGMGLTKTSHRAFRPAPSQPETTSRSDCVDQRSALDLSLAFSLGFETVPFALSLCCSRIARVYDIPVAVTAFAYMALRDIFPARLSATAAYMFGQGHPLTSANSKPCQLIGAACLTAVRK